MSCNNLSLKRWVTAAIVVFVAVTMAACSSEPSPQIDDIKDQTPSSFDFDTLLDAALDSPIESAPVTISSISDGTSVSVSGGFYRIDNGDYSAAEGTINSGQQIQLKGQSSSQYGATTTVTITIGTVTESFVIQTMAEPVAELTVDINFDVLHEKGGVNELDRSKFITIHAQINDKEWPSDEVRDDFIEDYDVYFGRTNGALPWQLSRLKQNAVNGEPIQSDYEKFGQLSRTNYANQVTAHKHEHRAANMMYGGQPIMYPILEHENACNSPCKANDWLAGFDALGSYFSNFLTHHFGQGGTTGEPKPKIIEVLNEPFVHSADMQSTNALISEAHSVVAKAIHKDHPEVKVGGYTAAYPQLEAGNFGQWNNGWKTFIDVAGEDMDFYSIHLYDGYKDGEHTYRVGANIEAILDMISHYSTITVGEAKPWVISEYGYFSPANTNERAYSKEIDWYNIRSFSTILMSLLERQDEIMMSIPFHILKALWYGNNGIDPTGYRYGTRLFILEEELSGEANVADSGNWQYSEILKFYQLWSDVQGKRVDSQANDIDLLTDAYVDGNTAYIIVSNLNSQNAETITLNMAGLGDATIESITSKHVYFDESAAAPVLAQLSVDVEQRQLSIEPDATLIWQITFDREIDTPHKSVETKYYAETYQQGITSNALNFAINNVAKTSEHGEAVLRLGLGREHGLSLQPELTVNGIQVPVPEDFRGYDQQVRDSFFGVIEVPVDYQILRASNDIKLSFSDQGGFVTSVALQVFEQSKPLQRTTGN